MRHSKPLDDMLAPGTSVDFLVPIDTASIDRCPPSDSGLYLEPGGVVSFGGVSYGSSSSVVEVNSADGSCGGGVTGMTVRVFYDGGTAPFSRAVIGWASGPGEALPTVPPSSALFSFAHGGSTPVVWGEITSAEVVPQPAPEPATLILTLSGLMLTAWFWRRRPLAGVRPC